MLGKLGARQWHDWWQIPVVWIEAREAREEQRILHVLAAGDFCQRCGVVKQEKGRCKCSI